MDDLNDIFDPRRPTKSRPLLGMTVLVVEDSRFTCEALRLMCLRSGARIRRADNLASAARHLKVYRPSAAIIDLGLPDGSGMDLIEEMANATPRVSVVLGMSGDDGMGQHVLAAGADGFLEKPIANLGLFQQTILAAVPDHERQFGPRSVPQDVVEPDLSAFEDDITYISDILTACQDGPTLDYVAQFLGGVARSARDEQLAEAAGQLSSCEPGDGRRRAQAARIVSLVQSRLQNRVAI